MVFMVRVVGSHGRLYAGGDMARLGLQKFPALAALHEDLRRGPKEG